MTKKVFLYMYPIEEFITSNMFRDKNIYKSMNWSNPLDILNETINKRYREKGYIIVYALFPYTKVYGINEYDKDKKIYCDINLDDYDKKGNPDSQYLLEELNKKIKLESISKLVVGGFYSLNCVRDLAKKSHDMGIDTLVDLELTELFFKYYRQDNFLSKAEYNPLNYKKFLIDFYKEKYPNVEDDIHKMYGDPIFGIYPEKTSDMWRNYFKKGR